MNPVFFTDNKLFRKTIQASFSNKNNPGTNIKLFGGDEILNDDEKIVGKLTRVKLAAGGQPPSAAKTIINKL